MSTLILHQDSVNSSTILNRPMSTEKKKSPEDSPSELKDHLAAKTEHVHEEAMTNDYNIYYAGGQEYYHESQGGYVGKGYGHYRMVIADFRKRFWGALVLTLPILVFSPMIQSLLGYQWMLPGNAYVLLGLSTTIYFWGGWPFLKGFWTEVKCSTPGMMTLTALAISVAYFYCSATVLGLPGGDFFWELAILIDILLLGHWLEMKSVLDASKALNLLVGMMPEKAHLVTETGIEDVPLKNLRRDDVILVKPGEEVPADGIIIEGEGFLNEAMLTGESNSIKKTTGDQIIGGSINGNSSFKVRVKHIGEDSYLAKVITRV